MTTKQTLPELLEASQGKKILFLGREEIFTVKDIARFLKKYDMTMTSEYEEDVVGVVEYHRLNPVEDDISNIAYDDNVPLYKLVDFEKLLSKGINDDELLMGIKLSNDQERIFRLLSNENISDSLFVKLLSMYEWHEDEEDHTDDRDVITYVLRRYIDIKPNEEDLLYSYLTLRRLATEARDPKMLMALIGFPNFSFLVRGKGKVTLRETIAKNEYLDREVLAKLTSLRDVRVDVAMACNSCVKLPLLQTLMAKNSEKINEALATNSNIDDIIFEALLSKEEKVVQLLLLSQPINKERLLLIDVQGLDEKLFATIGANEHLEADVIDTLIDRDSKALLYHLASNDTLLEKQIERIYAKGLPSTLQYLAINPATPVKMLEMLYAKYISKEVVLALAHNKSTPEVILRELFDRDEFEIHKSMASNASLPMELLDILKVDTRLQHELAQNEIFVKEYETVLDYDKKAVQF